MKFSILSKKKMFGGIEEYIIFLEYMQKSDLYLPAKCCSGDAFEFKFLPKCIWFFSCFILFINVVLKPDGFMRLTDELYGCRFPEEQHC